MDFVSHEPDWSLDQLDTVVAMFNNIFTERFMMAVVPIEERPPYKVNSN